MKNAIYFCLVCAIVLTNLACKGDSDSIGKIARKDSASEKSQQKPNSTPNVVYSDWKQLEFETVIGRANGLTYLRSSITVPQLTSDIVNNGVVLIYFKNPSGGIGMLPYAGATPGSIFVEKIIKGQIDIAATSNYNPETRLYRYVLISGGTLAKP